MEQVISLIGRPPDPGADVAALRLLADVRHRVSRLLCTTLRTSDRYREESLCELLHGLELVEPRAFWDRLSVRAANLLPRSGFVRWSDLCQASAADIEELEQMGPVHAEEVLGAVTREWALAYLRRWGALQSQEKGDESSAAALTASESGGLAALSSAFEELEEVPGFDIFKRRQLEPGQPPTLRSLAEASGRSKAGVGARANHIEKSIRRRLKEDNWPIGFVARLLQRRLGSVARSSELEGILSSVHQESGALPKEMPHRRALLLHVAEYRETEEWILGPDVETVTIALINAFTGADSATVDKLTPHLATFGIREELQLPWLASQYGYRIIDGVLVPC